MLNFYSNYECKVCKKEFILLTEEVQQISKDRYIACPYCNSKKVDKEQEANDLRELMVHRTYRKVHGVIRQKSRTLK
ncbi:hypothetical protein [Hathewaya limosa]|uniref:DNA-directed RNA polymerase subunit RPC12/RpoP n=1 Tax=Hathewaya limosa TaxID=1536 RepID=A0ABU0JRK9_HATLI|nr:hypothetical protein [Hathewaya limosa]MDQ0479733.1 DNA-directed RNA polymerase subunit RPC12/RpoP [Hathewaya limosa]